MNKVSTTSSVPDVCFICASPMHASVDCPCVGKPECVNEQVNAAQGFPPSNNSYLNTYNLG